MKPSELENFTITLYDVNDQLKRHVYDRSVTAFAKGDQARDEITTIDQLEKRRAFIREAFLQSIGGIPSSDTPLNPQVTGIVQGNGYKVEKIMFESRPKQWVTANLYIPEGIDGPTGTVLHVCGHNPLGKHAELYQTVSQHLVRAGLVVLTVDPIGQGERLSYYESSTGETKVPPSTREHEHVGKQCLPLGDNLARYFIHDAMRAIDYLHTRPEVDRERIGMTGVSGGGTLTSMMMLLREPRIAAFAPAAFIMNRESYMYAGQAQDAEQIWASMTKHGFDHEDILMAVAPLPTMVLAATYDFFPIEGTRRTVERTKRFWEMYGKNTTLEYFEDVSRHTYSVPMVKEAAAFFSKHLLGSPLNCSWEGIVLHDPQLLWCTKSGQVQGDRDDVRTVYEENGDRLSALQSAAAAASDWQRKDAAMKWLRDLVYHDRQESQLNPRRYELDALDNGLSVESLLWWSQPGLLNHGLLFYTGAFEEYDWPSPLPITIALWPRGTKDISSHMDWIHQTCLSGRAVLVLDVSGDGTIKPNQLLAHHGLHDFYGTMHKLTIDLFWLDDSLAALRTYDVIRALDLVDLIHGGKQDDTHLYVEGRFSLYAELAQSLDDRLKHVEVADGIESIAEWVRSRYYDNVDSEGIVIPGMLKWFDLPDLRAWRG